MVDVRVRPRLRLRAAPTVDAIDQRVDAPERPDRRTLPPDAGDEALRRPVVVAAVGPPLERVEVVGARLDHLGERLAAVACHPDGHADHRPADQPPDVQHRIQRSEPARLPHVHVLVVGDQAASALARQIAAAGDHVAERERETGADLEAAPVDVAIVAAAQLVVELRVAAHRGGDVRHAVLLRWWRTPMSSRARTRRRRPATASRTCRAIRTPRR